MRDNNRTNKIRGRRALGGDGWRKHLRPDGKRRANKAARKAAKEL